MIFRESVASSEALQDLSRPEGDLDGLHRLVRSVPSPCGQYQGILLSVVAVGVDAVVLQVSFPLIFLKALKHDHYERVVAEGDSEVSGLPLKHC